MGEATCDPMGRMTTSVKTTEVPSDLVTDPSPTHLQLLCLYRLPSHEGGRPREGIVEEVCTVRVVFSVLGPDLIVGLVEEIEPHLVGRQLVVELVQPLSHCPGNLLIRRGGIERWAWWQTGCGAR